MDKPYEYKKVRFEDDDAIIRNNQMIRAFLRSGADILVKMDIDQVYPKDYFTVMVPLAMKYKLAGPLIYSKRLKLGYPPLLHDDDIAPLRRIETDWDELTPENGMLGLNYAHTNLFYTREVLQDIDPPWYEVKHSSGGFSHMINRDFSFIEKLVKRGYKTYINMNMVVGHLVEEAITPKTKQALFQWSLS